MALSLAEGIKQAAQAVGVDPVDLATVISYETAGTFDPAKRGPTTKWGQHRGLIQFGEPQAQRYGVDWNDPVGSQLGSEGAVVRYLKDAGVKPGMGLLDLYSAVNAGAPGRYGASDAAAGGMPGSVADKVQGMGDHRKKAERLLMAQAGGETMTDAAPARSPYFDQFMSEAVDKPAPQGGSPYFNQFLKEQQAKDAPAAEPQGEEQSWLSGAFDSFTQGAAFGFGDELTATEAAILGRTPDGGLFDYSQPYGERYDAALAAERGQQERFGEAYPVTDTAAEIGGAVATGIATAGGSVANAATRGGQIARAAGAGAAGGAVYGVGDAEGGGINRALGGAEGALYGAAGGVIGREVAIGAQRLLQRLAKEGRFFADGKLTEAGKKAMRSGLQRLGLDPNQVTDEFAEAFGRRAQQAGGETDEVARMAVADEFGIPLTRGQATQDVPTIAFENAARAGARGRSAMDTVRGVDRAARTGARASIDTMAEGVGGQIDDTALAAAERVGEGVKRVAAQQQAAYRTAYKTAEQAGATIKTEAFDDLPRLAQDALDQVTFTPSAQASAAVKALGQLADKAKAGPRTIPSGGTNAVVPAGFTDDARAIGVSFQAVEQTRKKLNGIYGAADDQTRREIGAVISALDDWTENVMNSALIDGSEEALAAMQKARSEFSAFKRMFGRKTGDDASRIISDMVERDVTPQEVANWLYGASKVGAKGSSVRVAQKLKGILPAEDWNDVRAGAWRRIAETAEGEAMSPQKIQGRINSFLSGEGQALSKILFSENERATMRRFGEAMKLLVPPREATNPSGTGYEIARLVSDTWENMLMTLGFATGGPAGGIGAKMASAGGRGVREGMKARTIPAVSPRRAPGSVTRRPETGGAAVGGGAAATGERPENVPGRALNALSGL